MNKKIPIVKLTKSEEIWLRAIYDSIKQDKRPNYKEIRGSLFDKIPINFDASSINYQLAFGGGESITLLGIIALEKNYSILKKANTLIRAIRDILIKEPNLEHISAADLARRIKGIENEVEIMLHLISQYGHFHKGASLKSGNHFGYTSIDVNDNGVFNQYINFISIEHLMLMNLEEDKRRKSGMEREQLKTILDDSKPIERIFKSTITHIDFKLCFVIMPFTETWSEGVFKYLLRQNIEDLGIQCIRADNLTGPIIVEDIWVKINQAAFIIADVTNKNPNVMYELGIAHALSKPTILITQNINEIPFDFKHLRHHEYKNSIESGAKDFSVKIKPMILSIYKQYFPEIKLSNRKSKKSL